MPGSFGLFTANTWARSFLRHFRVELNGIAPDVKQLAKRTRENAVALFSECEASVTDKRDKSMLACCCLVLTAYRELQTQLPDSEAFEHVRAAVSQVFKQPMGLMARIWLWLPRSPIKRLRGNRWKRQSERMYGPGMQFDQEDSEGSVDLIVRRCAFHQFFVEHGEAHLTRVFCEWDRNWMDVVDMSGRSVHTERPTTISTGGDCCRFRLVSANNQATGGIHDVILVQLTPNE